MMACSFSGVCFLLARRRRLVRAITGHRYQQQADRQLRYLRIANGIRGVGIPVADSRMVADANADRLPCTLVLLDIRCARA